jgi:hypothetical protein
MGLVGTACLTASEPPAATRRPARPAAESEPAQRPGDPRQARATAPSGLRPSQLLLQRACACGGAAKAGGKCSECSHEGSHIAIGSETDPLEHEADRVAEQITNTPAASASISPGPSGLSRKSVAPPTGRTAPRVVHEVLRSPAQPLDAATRAHFEPLVGHDLSPVRLHQGPRAAESAHAVDALAYTVGPDIVFGSGQYAPETAAGRRLLAHELVHVAQQGAAGGVLRRAPCRSAAQCKAPNPGDTGRFADKAAAQQAVNAAKLKGAPAGSAGAKSLARNGQRAAAVEALLSAAAIPLAPEVFGFFVNPSIGDTAGAQVDACSAFPAPGPAGAPATKNCVQVPEEMEDNAKTLGAAKALTPKQERQRLDILSGATHEMQHARFDDTQSPTIGPEADCNLGTTVFTGATGTVFSVEFYLSELSAITSEFQVFFQNTKTHPGDAAKRSLEIEEEQQAFNADESILGCIRGLQCACSCATTDKFVQETVDLTTTGWAADQKTAFLKTMTSRIPSFWPKVLQR